ncbi:MAG: glucose-6-phosphate isomerase [Bdellovibrionales bacterium]|nr:glucose-6-phosphate isomerase [Bdellovibrionales bacterium]
MNNSELWTRYDTYRCGCSQLGIEVDISRMQFPTTFFDEMSAEIIRAFAEMEQLEQGALANGDEQRMVGHYWLRTPDLAPTPELSSQIKENIARISDFAQKVHREGKFEHVLLIGIGGSALGPQLVEDAFSSPQQPMGISFCDNTDPDGIARTIARLPKGGSTTLVIVISKSGGTKETRNGMLEVQAAFSASGLKFSDHAVAITGTGSKLYELAKSENWVDIFPIWDWVGGRTSIFSGVGLLPAALQGINISEFLAGGHLMDECTRASNPLDNPAMLLALMWHYAGGGSGAKDMVVLPYKDQLMLFSKYLQQLVMESLGKELDRDGNRVEQGIAVYGNKGSTDQHAYIQQLRDGLNNFFVTFIDVLKDSGSIEVEPGITSADYLSGFFMGTRRALYENQRESISITVEELTPKTLGALIALYERAVGFYASLVNINAYHQPGVEAGKKAAGRVIELQSAAVAALGGKKMTAAEIAEKIGASDEVETIYRILLRLAANPHRGVRKTDAKKASEVCFSAV